VTRLKPTPVAAVELMDRAALASVQDQPGVPPPVTSLGADAAALLIEVRGEDEAQLARHLGAALAALAGIPTVARSPSPPTPRSARRCEGAQGHLSFRRQPARHRHHGDHRGRRLPGRAAGRGHARPAAAARRARLRRRDHLRPRARGNLHFTFPQDFGSAAEVQRYARFMDEVAQLVVHGYDAR